MLVREPVFAFVSIFIRVCVYFAHYVEYTVRLSNCECVEAIDFFPRRVFDSCIFAPSLCEHAGLFAKHRVCRRYCFDASDGLCPIKFGCSIE
jgi:hypothetical protein